MYHLQKLFSERQMMATILSILKKKKKIENKDSEIVSFCFQFFENNFIKHFYKVNFCNQSFCQQLFLENN